jgi:aspartyl aminopeptidase
MALLESKPKYTTIVIGFDKEEVGSGGLAGARGRFFERVFNRVLTRQGRKLKDITEALREDIYDRSLAITADADVGSTHREEEVVDSRNVAKLGDGVFISGADGYDEGDQVSPYIADKVMTLLQRRNVIFETTGNPLPADSGENPTMNEFFINRGVPTINLGVPLGSLHSPTEESHIGDGYYAIQAYKAIIEEPTRKTKRLRR